MDSLPAHADFDRIQELLGTDVTLALADCPRLLDLLDKNQVSFHANLEDPDPTLMEEVRRLLPMDARSALGATWVKPGGGRCAILLGYEERRNVAELEKLFAGAVKITSRLAFYPGYVHLVARLESMAQAIRQSIVHDLKTPVTVIKGYADTLLDVSAGDDPALRQEMLAEISHQAERLVEDLNDILAPLDTAWKPHTEDFDLAPVVAEAIMAEKYTGRASGHRFDLTGAQPPVIVRADRRKIRRVVENLLSNAVKYSPGEGKTVRVRLQTDAATVRVVIQDEGIGMSPDQLAKVMSGTGRLGDAALNIEGTGFGLDSCRRVLGAHPGGRLEAESRYGEGSTFTAILPLAASDNSEAMA